MIRIRWPVVLALLATLILLRIGIIWAAEVDSVGSSLALAMAFLFPIGLTLVAWSALPAERSDQVAVLAPLALSLALVGYLALGFGLHFGGAAFISDDEELKSLSRFFSLLRGADSAGWGIAGLEGFFLSGDAATPSAMRLFVSQLPLVTAVTLIVLLALPRQTPPLAQLLAGLTVSAVTYPLAGHWVSGGGWLSQMGRTLGLGVGFIDFAGAGTVFVVGGATALAASLVFGQRQASPASVSVSMPPAQFPLLSSLGALLAASGWIALGLANPLYSQSDALDWSLIALNGLAGLAGGTLSAQIYSWFSSGRFDPLMGPRGALAGLIAVSAGAPFLTIGPAVVSGAVAGLLLPLAIYAVERLLRLDDATAAIATYGLSGFWGLLSVALFADLQAASGQLAAQVWGGIALFLLGFLLPWGVLKLVAGLLQLRFLPSRRTSQRADDTAGYLDPASESQGTPSGLNRVIDVQDRQ